MTNFEFEGYGKTTLVGYHWSTPQPKAVVLIIHGMSEHAARYDHFANYLTGHGIEVYSSDLRGHGKTAGAPEKVGLFALENGWHKVVQDQRCLIKHVQSHHSLPLFVLGHSMGSFLARSLSFSGENRVNGYLFSATAADPGFLGKAGKLIAGINARLMGKKNRSKLLDKLAFGDFNKKYENPRTVKDWLSRDESVVDKYMADPYCMQTFMSQFFIDLLEGIISINKMENIRKMDKVAYYLFSGTMDPVGDWGKGTQKVYDAMIAAGHKVELEFYEGGRHEMLNEINKNEVYTDLLNWINQQV